MLMTILFEELKIRKIEAATHVPKKFRFPLFAKFAIHA